MSERPRKVSNSRRLYMCKVPGCTVTPRGCDVSKHYKTKTDWSEVRELKAVAGSAALKAKLEQAEGHTKFAFINNYSEEHLPTWATHAPVMAAMVGGGAGAGASAKTPFLRNVALGRPRNGPDGSSAAK